MRLQLVMIAVLLAPSLARAQAATDPSLVFDRIEAMVPMRDGVRLQTEVYVPKGTTQKLPILFMRTPYGFSPDARGYSVWLSVALAARPAPRRIPARPPERAGPVRFRGQLRHRARAARPVPSGVGRRGDGRLRHRRVAARSRPLERPSRYAGRLQPGAPGGHGHARAAPGGQGLLATGHPGRQLHGRRLLPRRGLPAAARRVRLRHGVVQGRSAITSSTRPTSTTGSSPSDRSRGWARWC